jgi:hypothetical protein
MNPATTSSPVDLLAIDDVAELLPGGFFACGDVCESLRDLGERLCRVIGGAGMLQHVGDGLRSGHANTA